MGRLVTVCEGTFCACENLLCNCGGEVAGEDLENADMYSLRKSKVSDLML